MPPPHPFAGRASLRRTFHRHGNSRGGLPDKSCERLRQNPYTAEDTQVTLGDVCEPLFQYVCLLNRSARTGESYGLTQVRAQLEAVFAEMRRKAAGGRELSAQYEKVAQALVFFADFMLRQSGLEFAAQWENLAAEL